MIQGIRKSAPFRKAKTLARQIPQRYARAVAKPADYLLKPPAIANSFPKSGTHLLVQIAEGLPGTENYGRFIAPRKSRDKSVHSPAALCKKLLAAAPGEIMRSHLPWHPEHQTALAAAGIVHFFVYRDLRDVLVSHAFYLSAMNRWHRLHRFYASLPSQEERISVSIRGVPPGTFPFDFPDIGRRFEEYLPWVEDGVACAVRFEDLVSEQRRSVVARMVRTYAARSTADIPVEPTIDSLLDRMAPEKSHTFREGRTGAWREHFTDRLKDEFKASAGELLIRLGYEKDQQW